MTRKLVSIIFAITIFSSFVSASDGLMPPIDWGEAPSDVIDKPYLCRDPLTVEDGIEVHTCTMRVLSRNALVSFYFVDGSYACFEVTMEASGGNGDQILREFNGLVEDLEIEVGQAGGRDAIPDGEPRATWLTEDETIRAAVQWSGSTPLIGIIALAGDHHRRMANLVRW